MAWYNPSDWFKEAEEKANPAQAIMAMNEGSVISSDSSITYIQAFDKLETVNRGVSMIVNACSSLDFDIKDKTHEAVSVGIRVKSLNTLLNFRPNPFQSAQEFRACMFTDFLLDGNIFLYYDGAFLYHLPAVNMQIMPDPKTLVAGYKYQGITDFKADEIIHIRDLNSTSIYRGTSRLAAAARNITILYKMQAFQEQFFDNGAVAGLIITTENSLSQVAKDKTLAMWAQRYSPKNGAKRPLILDNGMKPNPVAQSSFQEMDFDTSIKTHDTKILKALGVPPILMDGGNNANISPNLRLFYLETVMPIVNKFNSAMERYFGYDIAPITNNVSALQPELKDVAAYHSTLVNAGILTPNEARVELRYPELPGKDATDIRVPANIAGSAADPSQGGAPKKPTTPKEPAAKQ